MTAIAPHPPAAERSVLRAVAMPSEHGGWGLTLEPVLLGLLVAWSWAGLLVGVAAFGAFLVRTPAKLVGVDLRRGRRPDRMRVAARVAAVETVVIVVAVALATASAGWRWWVPVAIAAPLVAVEAWYDVRSRGRRLVPELSGAVGVAAAAAAVASAGGASDRLTGAVWMVLAARSIGAIPFVRSQIVRARRGIVSTHASDAAQVASVALAVGAAIVERRVLAGAVALALVAATQMRWSRHDAPLVKTLGLRQMAIGLAVVAVTAAGVALP
jgi:YwiC-like protein